MTTRSQCMTNEWDERMRRRIIELAMGFGWRCRCIGLEADSDAAMDWLEDYLEKPRTIRE